MQSSLKSNRVKDHVMSCCYYPEETTENLIVVVCLHISQCLDITAA
jgi:hypothetical protein